LCLVGAETPKYTSIIVEFGKVAVSAMHALLDGSLLSHSSAKQKRLEFILFL